ncbi:germination protein M [Tumebacillus sp. BK434]|uniref:GerMN domain-containing protein n=1 Tax=Tumebacillus sp. BK434 TaxID=2512169 RepID=UPI0010ED852C|nr:GerMN domain-containing protein [Tumebacillus sp. BK434]TCP54751.1 germination protein M [Tumebacillus sp. BK434]
MRKRKLALVGVLAVTIAAATGCSATPEKTSAPGASQGAGQVAEKVMPTTVYVADQNGFVVPLNIKMEQTNQVAHATMQHMIAGGSGDAALVGTGFRNLLPEGTKIRGISINEGVANVDFTKEVNELKSGADEQAMVDAVVWSLTGLENINKVQFMIEGHVVNTMKNGTPVGDPISRANGINLQMTSNLSPSNATALTLYFAGKSNDSNFSYLVPVTRMVPKAADQNMIELTLAELAKGPNSDALEPVVSPELKLNKSAVAEKTATLDFASQLAADGGSTQKIVNSIALSVAANADVDKVKFTVGEKAPKAGVGLDLTQPVMIPKTINEQKL